ncbi:hypothetical protein AB0M43_23305 [Longispora sp. NPDC051575]|uniref:hypothetical protein n=1 Tax=Longispora sp. NPDC051575 TaxID=3154943 RepID=UPI003431C73B
MTELAERLRWLRGGAAPVRYTARTIAALTANPGCARRGLLDAAGVDKKALADRLGHPARFGQSRFAITRTLGFEARLKADGYAELLAAVALDGARVVTVELTIDIAGEPAALEPDLVLLRAAGRLHVVQVKSFAVVDGQAPGDKVAAAARQAAVHVLALRRLGHDTSHEVYLVCPENFSNAPVANLVDVRRELGVLERQLARLTRVSDLAEGLPDGATAEEAVERVPARYAPECLAACELAFYCRQEARCAGETDTLGRSVRDAVGGVATVAEVRALAAGGASAEHPEIAELLATARTLRAEATS